MRSMGKLRFYKGLRGMCRWLAVPLAGVMVLAIVGAGEGLDDYDRLIRAYDVPTEPPVLVRPEVVVTLETATVLLRDPVTGFQELYEAGVGRLDDHGESRTPVGRFTTGPDPGDPWWYMPRRITPQLYGGFPFLRFSAEQPEGGGHVYGFHGPLNEKFKRGYVSGGCVRLRPADLIRLYYALHRHPSVPVIIRRAVPASAPVVIRP